MLDNKALQLYAYLSIMTGIFFHEIMLAAIFFPFLGLLLLVLSWSVKPSNLKLTVRGAFEDNLVTNEILDRLKTDPEFSQAVDYIRSLSSTDFLRFVRLSVEIRAKSDRMGLEEVGNLFKRKSK